MKLPDAVRIARESAQRTKEHAYVVFDPARGETAVDGFHVGDAAALKSVYLKAQRIALVDPLGRTEWVQTPVAA
jgi:hypothetical protein